MHSAIAVAALLAVTVPCQDENPLERHGHRAHVLGDRVFAFGGFAGAGASDRGMRRSFLRTADGTAWLRRADMATPRAFFGSAMIDGAVYAVGSSIDRYDPEANTWTTVLPAGRVPKSHHATAAFRGKLHVLGGFPRDVAGHQVFDPKTGELKSAPAPPAFARGDHLHILVAIGDHLHCVGGLGSGMRKGHTSFDGERWSERASPPAPLWAKFAVYAVVGDSLFVFSETANLRYDAKVDRWSEVAPIPRVVAMPATVVRDGRIEVIGGRALEGKGYGVGRYDPVADRWLAREVSHRQAERR